MRARATERQIKLQKKSGRQEALLNQQILPSQPALPQKSMLEQYEEFSRNRNPPTPRELKQIKDFENELNAIRNGSRIQRRDIREQPQLNPKLNWNPNPKPNPNSMLEQYEEFNRERGLQEFPLGRISSQTRKPVYQAGPSFFATAQQAPKRKKPETEEIALAEEDEMTSAAEALTALFAGSKTKRTCKNTETDDGVKKGNEKRKRL